MVRPCWLAPYIEYILFTCFAGAGDAHGITKRGKYTRYGGIFRVLAPLLYGAYRRVRHAARSRQFTQRQPRRRAQPLYFIAYIFAVYHHGGKSTKKTATKRIAAVIGRRAAQGYRSPNLRAAASKSVEQ